MENKELIIHLIQQDLKHHQLIYGLKKIGLDDVGLHSLELLNIVSNLMEVTAQVSDHWTHVYCSFMEEGAHLAIQSKTASLKPLAEVCYRQLKASLMKKTSS